MSVIIQMWKRLAPSRTKKLSTSWVMILRLTGRGKVARCGLCFSLVCYEKFLIFEEKTMDTEQTKKMIAKIKDTLKQVFDVEDSDFVVQGSTEEYTAYSDAYSEFALKQYIYYIIKPTNHKTRFKLRLRDGKIKFEIKIFEDFPIIFENFDFSMPIFVGNEVGEIDKIYQPIAFRDCNIKLVSATAINNTFVSQRISFERCDIKELQIHKTIFAEEISFYENVILYVSLSNCIFQKNLYFNHSILKEKVDFHESEFEKVACFYGAKFKKAPNFSACYFKEPRAVNLVNIDIDSLDFKQVEDYIKDNFKDEWCKQEIVKSQNKDKEIEIEQKYRLRYAQNAKDSFRAIKDILIGQNNTLEAQEWHKLELYAEEKELEINFALKRRQKESNLYKNILILFNCSLLQFYRLTSNHHTNFISILNFTIGVIALYGFYSFSLFEVFSNQEMSLLLLFTTLPFAFVMMIFFNDSNISIDFLWFFLICLTLLIILLFHLLNDYLLIFVHFVSFACIIFSFYTLFSLNNDIFVFLMRFLVWVGFLWILLLSPQLINPFIGIFSNDKLFESKFEQKLSDLNSSTIINLAKLSQKEFTLQDDYNVSFAELNSAKMVVLSNKNNITALKDENLTKATEILGHTLYSEISQAIKQDEIVSDIIKSTSIIYSIIFLLCIFSLQKTARKNSIIPS